jgi:molecular chaperone DnaK (HSP70)
MSNFGDDDKVYGIDFGTTNSCISFIHLDTGHPIVLQNTQGEYITPSVIYFNKDSDEILYGSDAKVMLNKSEHLSNTVHNFKRLFGITYDEYINNKDLQKFFDNYQLKIVKTNFDFCGIQIEFKEYSKVYCTCIL